MLTKLLLIYPLNYYKNPLDISTANNSPDSETLRFWNSVHCPRLNFGGADLLLAKNNTGEY